MDTRERTRTREHGTTVTNPADSADPGLTRIEAFRQIVRRHQYAKIDGYMVDGFSASAVVQLYDNINPANQERYRNRDAADMADIACKVIQKIRSTQ